jgi:hypothetical protein
MNVRIPTTKKRRPAMRWTMRRGSLIKTKEPKITPRNVDKTKAKEAAKKTKRGDF